MQTFKSKNEPSVTLFNALLMTDRSRQACVISLRRIAHHLNKNGRDSLWQILGKVLGCNDSPQKFLSTVIDACSHQMTPELLNQFHNQAVKLADEHVCTLTPHKSVYQYITGQHRDHLSRLFPEGLHGISSFLGKKDSINLGLTNTQLYFDTQTFNHLKARCDSLDLNQHRMSLLMNRDSSPYSYYFCAKLQVHDMMMGCWNLSSPFFAPFFARLSHLSCSSNSALQSVPVDVILSPKNTRGKDLELMSLNIGDPASVGKFCENMQQLHQGQQPMRQIHQLQVCFNQHQLDGMINILRAMKGLAKHIEIKTTGMQPTVWYADQIDFHSIFHPNLQSLSFDSVIHFNQMEHMRGHCPRLKYVGMETITKGANKVEFVVDLALLGVSHSVEHLNLRLEHVPYQRVYCFGKLKVPIRWLSQLFATTSHYPSLRRITLSYSEPDTMPFTRKFLWYMRKHSSTMLNLGMSHRKIAVVLKLTMQTAPAITIPGYDSNRNMDIHADHETFFLHRPDHFAKEYLCELFKDIVDWVDTIRNDAKMQAYKEGDMDYNFELTREIWFHFHEN